MKIAGILGAYALVAVNYASAQLSTSTGNTIYDNVQDSWTDMITTNLPAILTTLGVLLAIGWLVARFKRHTGARKV